MYGHFKWQTSKISCKKTWTWLKKGNLKRETESLLIAVQNNTKKTNYVKAKIDKTQCNSRFRLCGNWDETINHISKCNKLVQKEFKTRYDWLGKFLHWELCKKFKFDHTNKCYGCNPESVLENVTHKLLSQMTRPSDSQEKKREPPE